MTVLVTRPEPGASRTVAALAARGALAISAPLFTIEPTVADRPNGRFAALIVTSANGVAGLTPQSADLAADLPVFAVGDRTAEAARENGFTQVTSASGDQKALTRLVLARLPPRFRVLLVTGEDHKDGLPAAFAAAGHEIALWVRYRAEPVATLPEAAREALRAGRITAVLHYSRRASETFAALAAGAGLDAGASANWAKVRHIALSPDVAEPLLSAGFSHIAVAPQPDEDHLLDLVAPAQDGVDQPGADPAGGADDSVAHGVSDAEAAASGSAAVRAPVSRAPVSRATSRVRQAGAPPARSSEASRAIVSDAAIGPAHDAGPALPDAPDPPYGGASPEPTASAMSTPVPPMLSTPQSTSADPAPVAADPALAAAGVAGASRPGSVPVTTARPGPGWAGVVAAAFMGGVVGAAVYAYLAPQLGRFGVVPPPVPGIEALSARLSQVEARAQAPSAASPTLDRALERIGAQAAEQRQQFDALSARIAGFEARPAQVQASSGPDAAMVASLRQRLDQVEQAAGAMAGRVAQAEAASRAGSQPGGAALAAARLIVADRLARAVAEGRPFQNEWTTLSSLGAAAEPMAALQPLAAAGAPALQPLLAEFRTLRAALAIEPASADSPWYERMLRMTDGLVRVRSTGAVEGSSPVAVTARIDQALQRGDSAAAAAAWAQLPEPARRASEAWIRQVRQRAGAEQAIRTITDSAIKALSDRQDKG
jgi:uroporphyrinogen-III synthase